MNTRQGKLFLFLMLVAAAVVFVVGYCSSTFPDTTPVVEAKPAVFTWFAGSDCIANRAKGDFYPNGQNSSHCEVYGNGSVSTPYTVPTSGSWLTQVVKKIVVALTPVPTRKHTDDDTVPVLTAIPDITYTNTPEPTIIAAPTFVMPTETPAPTQDTPVVTEPPATQEPTQEVTDTPEPEDTPEPTETPAATATSCNNDNGGHHHKHH